MSCPNTTGAPLLSLEGAADWTSPDALLLLLSPVDAEFDRACVELRRQLATVDLLGVLLADQLVLAARRLRKAARLEPADAIPDAGWCRYHALAERGFRTALTALNRHQTPQGPAKGGRQTAEPASEGPPPEAAPPAPVRVESSEEIAEARSNWRDRIALVRSVSKQWPIILRTHRQVEDVAAWLVDGRTEQELLGWYPDLTRLDIAACLGCEAEGLCGPFDPDFPDPPGLPILDELPEGPNPV